MKPIYLKLTSGWLKHSIFGSLISHRISSINSELESLKYAYSLFKMKVFDGTPKNPELDFKNVEIENSIDEEFVFDVNLVEELIIKR